jgi:hypothetical protein
MSGLVPSGTTVPADHHPAPGNAEVRARVQWIRGMCTDDAPHVQIDDALGEILDLLDAVTATR